MIFTEQHNYLFKKYNHYVDARLLFLFTDGLYVRPEISPTLNEFRDMFSAGQMLSKFWLIDELSNARLTLKNLLIVGGWFGLTSYYLHTGFPEAKITTLDLDPKCERFLNHVSQFYQFVTPKTEDMYAFSYNSETHDLIVNTSCEHIENIREWLNLLPKNQLVALQSNNFKAHEDHGSCVSSLEEFRQQTNLKEILFAGELEFRMYTRYMIIGRV